MIRRFEVSDTDKVMDIWLKANIKAHDFIPAGYWKGNYDPVKNMLPDATVFVYADNNEIKGFIGLKEHYIAGIFIDTNNQSKGMGKELLDYVKKHNTELFLRVYKKNVRAVKFYLREDFSVLKEQVDENTGEIELVMRWVK
jgi:ribosomal protein S18 acetylase RimI-like enzyme